MPDGRGVEVSVADGGIQVETGFDISPRHRLFLRSIGATAGATERTWIVPLRLLSRAEVIGRLHSQFSRDGVEVALVGEADREATEELERVRSFQRTMQAGRLFHDSGSTLSAGTIRAQLDLVGWNFAARNLRPHQMAAVAHALTVMNAANFSVPGAGKTATTLAVIAAHLASETIDTIVMVGPLASFGPWEGEAAAALPGVLDVRRVRGPSSAARAFTYRAADTRSLLLVTYPTVVADISELLRLAERRKLLLVVDESHRIKRFKGGQWAPAMMRLASASKVRMILSGTPMPQGPLDLWSQLNVLWPRERLTGSRSTFKARASGNFAALAHDLEPVFTRTPKAALGIPPYEVLRHIIEAPPLQRDVVDLITDRFRRNLPDAGSWQDKLNSLRQARPLRLIQAASNPDLLNTSDGFFELPPFDGGGSTLMQRLAEYRKREVPAKFGAALDLLREQVEQGQKTVVWTSFVKNIDQFAELCRTQLGVDVYTVDGRVPAADADFTALDTNDPGEEVDATREARIASFLANQLPAILIANPAACGESVSLHSACTTAVYLDRTYDCARFLQSVDRVHRLGLPPDARVRVHMFMTTVDGMPTADQLVDASLNAKQARMENLLEGSELVPAQIPPETTAANGDDADLDALLRYLLGQ